MSSLLFNPTGQVMLIITSQEQAISAVAGIKYTPPVYISLISRHLLEVKHSLTLQVLPGYGEEKRRHFPAYIATQKPGSLKAPSLFRGQYLQKTIEHAEEMCANVRQCTPMYATNMMSMIMYATLQLLHLHVGLFPDTAASQTV